jgi:hypothetical protein
MLPVWRDSLACPATSRHVLSLSESPVKGEEETICPGDQDDGESASTRQVASPQPPEENRSTCGVGRDEPYTK